MPGLGGFPALPGFGGLAWAVSGFANVTACARDASHATAPSYSAVQADRGKGIVEVHCSACHGTDLGGVEGPALVGESFMLEWENQNLEMLFRRIRDTMPAGAISSITDDEKLDAIAYLMQRNGFAEGALELPRDADARARIQLSSQSGATTLRTGSLVRVSGCLSQDSGNAWVLTNAGEPRSARIPDPHSAPGDSQPGTQTVRLLNVFPDPSPHKGHRMEASGLLVRDAAGSEVNVLSLEMLGPSCEK